MRLSFVPLWIIPSLLLAQSYIGESPYSVEDKLGKPFDVRDPVYPRDYELRVYRGKDGGPIISLYVAPDGKVHAVELSSRVERNVDRPNPQFADKWAPLPKAHLDAFLNAVAEGLKWEALPKDQAPFILRRSDGKIAVRLERLLDANGRIESAKLTVAAKDFSEAMKWIPSPKTPKY